MSLKHTLTEWMTEAKTIREQRGTIALLNSIFLFFLSPIYKSVSYYLTVSQRSSEFKSAESRPLIDEDKLNFKVITSNQEADELEKEGFSFRSDPTYFNHNLTLYNQWLDYGAIAFCTFIEKEFAAINWIILS
jgi:hypothetical protein